MHKTNVINSTRRLLIIYVLLTWLPAWSTDCRELLPAIELPNPQETSGDSLYYKLLESVNLQKTVGGETRSLWSPKLLRESGMAIVHAFNAFGIIPSSPNFILVNGVIPKNSILSTSVISAEKNATAGFFGVILTVPEQAILITSPADLDLNLDRRRGDDFIIRGFQRKLKHYGVRGPKDILSNTLPNDYNEIVISTNGVTISGLFLKTDSEGNRLFVERKKAVSDEDLSLLEKLSAKLNIPITKIPVAVH